MLLRLQPAAGRTISGTGEATFTTGALMEQETQAAVTLLNSAVISKVLTGMLQVQVL
jgi:hypothetical protein